MIEINEAEARLQQYQEQMLEVINMYPVVIEHVDWCALTNGFDSDEIGFFVRGIYEERVMLTLTEVLKEQWLAYLADPVPQMFVDKDTCDILRYGSEECPVRFSVFIKELRRQWKISNS